MRMQFLIMKALKKWSGQNWTMQLDWLLRLCIVSTTCYVFDITVTDVYRIGEGRNFNAKMPGYNYASLAVTCISLAAISYTIYIVASCMCFHYQCH